MPSYGILSGALGIWIINTFHRAAIWIPSLGGRGGYDGIGHEQLARRVARGLVDGSTSVFELTWLSNPGYRNILGVFYALTDAPNFVAVAIHGLMAYCGLLFTLEAVAIATKIHRFPKWLVLYTMFLPSALIFTPWILKEAPALWGIGLILRFGADPQRWLRSMPATLLAGLGAATVFSMRPHIGGAWMLAAAVGHFAPLKRPMYAIASVIAATAFFALTMMAADKIAPNFSAQAEQIGVIDTLDQMTDHAQGGSAIYRETTPIPFLNGLIFIFLEPNPLYWGRVSYAIVGIEAWFITIAMLMQWKSAPNKIGLLMTPPAMMCTLAILAIGFYLGYMYNMGLMVRQRLQVMPALILLAAIPLGVQQRQRQR